MPARSARVSFLAGLTVSSTLFASFFRLQIPAQTPSTTRNGVPGRPFVAALAVRGDLLAHLGRDELLPLAEPHHVEVVLRQKAHARPRLDPVRLRQVELLEERLAASGVKLREVNHSPELPVRDRPVGVGVPARNLAERIAVGPTRAGRRPSRSGCTNVTFDPAGGPKQSTHAIAASPR